MNQWLGDDTANTYNSQNDDSESFQSPIPEGDLTDYGLEFTGRKFARTSTKTSLRIQSDLPIETPKSIRSKKQSKEVELSGAKSKKSLPKRSSNNNESESEDTLSDEEHENSNLSGKKSLGSLKDNSDTNSRRSSLNKTVDISDSESIATSSEEEQQEKEDNFIDKEAPVEQVQTTYDTAYSTMTKSKVTVAEKVTRKHKTNSADNPKTKRKQKNPIKKSKSTKILAEIVKLQKETKTMIPKLCFSRLVREVMQEIHHELYRVTPDCLHALQESAELYLTHFLSDAYLCTVHRGRLTLVPKDMQLALRLRGYNDPGV